MRNFLDRHGRRIFNVDYELLTVQQETQTRSLIDYLGLEWQESCLSPQDNSRGVSTASQIQVRRAVYSGSSQKWRKYESFLKEPFRALEPLKFESL